MIESSLDSIWLGFLRGGVGVVDLLCVAEAQLPLATQHKMQLLCGGWLMFFVSMRQCAI